MSFNPCLRKVLGKSNRGEKVWPLLTKRACSLEEILKIINQFKKIENVMCKKLIKLILF